MGIPAVRRSALGVALSVALSSALRGAAPAAQEPPQPEPTDLTDVSFMERLIPSALKVRLENGEKKTQDLTLVR